MSESYELRFPNGCLVRLLGTSHIAAQSLAEVRLEFEEHTPEIVALEIDAQRFPALFQKRPSKYPLSMIKQLGFTGYFFAIIAAWAEKKMGSIVGVKPGSEMKTAALLARKHQSKLAFIDQNISITFKKLTKRITWKEKFRFAFELITSPFNRKKIPFDLSKVPSSKVVQKLLKETKTKYPSVYSVLIKERNAIMAKKIYYLGLANPDSSILALVGAGHAKDMLKLISHRINRNS